jgi:hypothetical protein
MWWIVRGALQQNKNLSERTKEMPEYAVAMRCSVEREKIVFVDAPDAGEAESIAMQITSRTDFDEEAVSDVRIECFDTVELEEEP